MTQLPKTGVGMGYSSGSQFGEAVDAAMCVVDTLELKLRKARVTARAAAMKLKSNNKNRNCTTITMI